VQYDFELSCRTKKVTADEQKSKFASAPLAFREEVLVFFHYHDSAAEAYAFRLQSQPLLESVLAFEQNAALGSDYAMPRQARGRGMQCPNHLSCRSRMPGSPGYTAVSCDFAARYAAHRLLNPSEHRRPS
jgi:hypothetical protein